MPAPTGELDAGLGSHYPGCETGLAFIPHSAEAALKRAEAAPAIKRFGAPVVDLMMSAAKRATDVTNGQRFGFLDALHVSWAFIRPTATTHCAAPVEISLAPSV
jgi:hypothetical protein